MADGKQRMTPADENIDQTAAGATGVEKPGVAGQHLDWMDDELIGKEGGGRHPLGEMSDQLQPEQEHQQMADRIARGPGDDPSSMGGDVGAAGGGDVGVLGGDPGGQAAGLSGQASRSYTGGTGEIGGLGGRPARNIGGLEPGGTSLGGPIRTHAVGEGSGLDAGPVDVSLEGAGTDASGTAAPGTPGGDDQTGAANPVVSERLHGQRGTEGSDPRPGDDAGRIGGDLAPRS